MMASMRLLASLILSLSLVVLAEPAWAKSASRAYRGLSPETRALIQDALIWSGHYDGQADGTIGSEEIRAIQRFQKEIGNRPTGVLSREEAEQLAARAREARQAVGYTSYTDAETGLTIGLPLRLAPFAGRIDRGSRFASPDRRIEIELFRFRPGEQSLRDLFRRIETARPGRRITYARRGRDGFVISGTEGSQRFYMRARETNDGIAAFAVGYDASAEQTMEPVIAAMSSSFANPAVLTAAAPPASAREAPPEPPETPAVPGAPGAPAGTASMPPGTPAPEVQTAARATPRPPQDPQPERPTPLVAASFAVAGDGHFLTTAQVAACRAISVGSFGAATVKATDAKNDLALLKLEASPNSPAGTFAQEPIGAGERVTTARPQANAEAPAYISIGKVMALVGPDGDTRHFHLAAPPRADDGGAPVLDGFGRVVGILTPMTREAAMQAVAGPQRVGRVALRKEIVQLFLTAHGISPSTATRPRNAPNSDALAETARNLTQPVFCADRRG